MINGVFAVDAHCHIGALKGEMHGIAGFSAEQMVASMDQTGIDVSVVCHFVSPLVEPEEVRRGNDVVLEAARAHPDRIAAVCIVNPRHGDFACEELRRCADAGVRGVKLQPVAHGHYPVDGPIVDPVVDVARRAGLPVVIHSDFATTSCSPHQVAALAARYPDATFVMLHLGLQSHQLLHVPEVVGPTRNVVVDTSQTHDLPYGVYVHTVRRLGADRVLFGSDGPIASVEVNLTKLAVAERDYGLTADERRSVLGANAARVFGIGVAQRRPAGAPALAPHGTP